MTTATKTRRAQKSEAHETYAKRRMAIAKKMKTLHATLAAHGRDEQRDPENWGFAGDLHRINEQLDEVLEVLAALA